MQHCRSKVEALEMASASKYFDWYAAMKSLRLVVHGTLCPIPIETMQDNKLDFEHEPIFSCFNTFAQKSSRNASIWDNTQLGYFSTQVINNHFWYQYMLLVLF